MSNRGNEWKEFSTIVLKHVEEYTVPQYGDSPTDPVSEYGLAEFEHNLRRYVNRMRSSQRGMVERKRDALKIAHYACLVYNELLREEGIVRI